MNKTALTLMISGAISVTTIAPSASAGVIDQVKSKVYAIKEDTGTLKSRTSQLVTKANAQLETARATAAQVTSISDLAAVAESLVQGEQMQAVIDAVQPGVDLVVEYQRDYAAFDAEGFRTDLGDAVQVIADIQLALSGETSERLNNLQTKIDDANPAVLYALGQTPIVGLLELTEGMQDELSTITRLVAGASDHVQSHYPERAARMFSLGMSAIAPEFISCDFVNENIYDDDVDNLKMSRARAARINRLLTLVGKVLPKHQTIGVNVVGGATVSIPNPVPPMLTGILQVTGKYQTLTEDLMAKLDSCAEEELDGRLSDFLASQGF